MNRPIIKCSVPKVKDGVAGEPGCAAFIPAEPALQNTGIKVK
jgi:hypothetical protein